MTFREELEEHFGTTNLYEVLEIDSKASAQQIKKAYRNASLKIHPDRVEESEKDKATKRFQVLAKVHFVLSDEEKRKLYDEHGILADDDSFDSETDWEDYWRLLFPKISEKDIQEFMDKYTGSNEEIQDLINLYNKFKGDMDKISETMISYDEERTTKMLKELIKEGKIEDYHKFTNESDAKKRKRTKRYNKEAEEASKARDELQRKTGRNVDSMDDLTALIKRKQQGFDSMIASLEARYSKPVKKTKKQKK